MDRRDFLKGMAVSASLAALVPQLVHAQAAGETREGDMIYRTLGKTGEKVSLIGLGGYHIGIPKDEQEAIRIVRSAVDSGINFMDNCWDYHNGESEVRMGKALQEGYRDKVFLMTKLDGRTKDSAAKQIDESLQRLQTDRIDLMQFHEIIRMEDPDRILGEGGSMEAVKEAQKAGKIRYVGFTGHKDPIVHLRMLEIADKYGVQFDAVQMPVNVFDAHFRSFTRQVLPELTRRQIGVLGMKPMANGEILKTSTATPVECLHFAMSQPTSVVITGMESMERLQQGLQAVREFKPLGETQVAALLEKTATPAATGKFEPFKTTHHYDGTAHHPEWMG